MINTLGLKYTNILSNDKFRDDFLRLLDGTPTTLFFDGEGKQIEEPMVGTNGKEKDIEYIKGIIEENIK